MESKHRVLGSDPQHAWPQFRRFCNTDSWPLKTVEAKFSHVTSFHENLPNMVTKKCAAWDSHVDPEDPKLNAPKSTAPLKSVSTSQTVLSKHRVLASDPQHAAPKEVPMAENTDTSLYATVETMDSHVTASHDAAGNWASVLSLCS